MMNDLNTRFPKFYKYLLPLVWAASIATRARMEGRIRHDSALNVILGEMNKFREQCDICYAMIPSACLWFIHGW